MKKLITVCLILVMLITMSLPTFAVGGFVESPSNNPAPEVIESENESEDCESEIIITPYIEKDELPEDVKENLEEAYDDIKENPNLGDLVEELEEIAEELEIDVIDLAVSDLFDVGCTDCDDHENHGEFSIVFEADTLKNFVALLQYVDGVWTVVSGAKVSEDGTRLEFTSNGVGAFAIVVDASMVQSDSPKTGDNSAFLVASAVVSGLALVVIGAKYKKNKA